MAEFPDESTVEADPAAVVEQFERFAESWAVVAARVAEAMQAFVDDFAATLDPVWEVVDYDGWAADRADRVRAVAVRSGLVARSDIRWTDPYGVKLWNGRYVPVTLQ